MVRVGILFVIIRRSTYLGPCRTGDYKLQGTELKLRRLRVPSLGG